MSNFTLKQLEALEQSIAEGALRVEYNGKVIVYRSLSEMIAVRDLIRKELGLSAKSARLKAEFSKGIGC